MAAERTHLAAPMAGAAANVQDVLWVLIRQLVDRSVPVATPQKTIEENVLPFQTVVFGLLGWGQRVWLER